MDWTLSEYSYDILDENGSLTETTIRWWIGSQENASIRLEALAGEQQRSLPSEYREDASDYTEVFVRAIDKASGAFLWLSELSEGIQAPVSDLTGILSSLDGYSGEPKQAYQEL